MLCAVGKQSLCFSKLCTRSSMKGLQMRRETYCETGHQDRLPTRTSRGSTTESCAMFDDAARLLCIPGEGVFCSRDRSRSNPWTIARADRGTPARELLVRFLTRAPRPVVQKHGPANHGIYTCFERSGKAHTQSVLQTPAPGRQPLQHLWWVGQLKARAILGPLPGPGAHWHG